jgi:hypothetical protein
MQRVYATLFDAIDGKPNTKGTEYHLDMLSTTCHIYFGKKLGASPNGRFAHLGVIGIADAPDIIAVAKGEEGKDAYGCMFYGMNPTHEMETFFLDDLLDGRFNLHPETVGFKRLSWQVQRIDPQQFLAAERPLLISGNAFRDLKPSFTDEELGFGSAPKDLNDLRILFRARPREVPDV